MQGNCTSTLPAYATPAALAGVPLATPQDRQCLVLVDVACMRVDEGDLWLSHVLLRVQNTTRSTALASGSEEGSALVEVGSNGRLWMTDVTLQGHGEGATVQALSVQGPVLCSGTFLPFFCFILCSALRQVSLEHRNGMIQQQYLNKVSARWYPVSVLFRGLVFFVLRRSCRLPAAHRRDSQCAVHVQTANFSTWGGTGQPWLPVARP